MLIYIFKTDKDIKIGKLFEARNMQIVYSRKGVEANHNIIMINNYYNIIMICQYFYGYFVFDNSKVVVFL